MFCPQIGQERFTNGERYPQCATPVEPKNHSTKCVKSPLMSFSQALMQGILIGGLLCIGGAFFLYIQFGLVGWVFLAFGAMFIFMGPWLGASAFVKGICPYCGAWVVEMPEDGMITCHSCQNHIEIRDETFNTVIK